LDEECSGKVGKTRYGLRVRAHLGEPAREPALETALETALGQAVRLRRSTPDEPGIARRRRGAGFSYVDAHGDRLADREILKRIKALAVPPAWQNVWICASDNGHVQATGTDADGRTQYRYHPRWSAQADRTKFQRVRALSQQMPALRAHVTRDLRSDSAEKRALAIAVRLIDLTGMRLGDERYARERGTIGTLTLEHQHAAISGDRISLDFVAKSGVRWITDIVDSDLVAAIRRAPTGPTSRLTSWIDNEDDQVSERTVHAASLTAYLRTATGLPVSAKDLRTLLGSRLAAQALARGGLGATAREQEVLIRAAIVTVATQLRNTVAVARSSYVDPQVLERYRRGVLADLSRGRVTDAALARLLGAD
jgi:DNA topoisomerase-1